MYKTLSSNYKQQTLEEKKIPMFQMVSDIWKNNLWLSLLCDIFATDAICVRWQVELSIAQLDENHNKHGVFCPPGEWNRYIRSVFC